MPEHLTPREAAEFLGVPLSWVYSKAEAGELPSFKLGHYVRFSRVRLAEWLAARERPSKEARRGRGR